MPFEEQTILFKPQFQFMANRLDFAVRIDFLATSYSKALSVSSAPIIRQAIWLIGRFRLASSHQCHRQ